MNTTKYLTNLPDKKFKHHIFSNHYIVVASDQISLRLDKFLTERLPTTTRTKIQLAIKYQLILTNHKPTKASYQVRPHDVIQVWLPQPPSLNHVVPEAISLHIIYEDDALLIINKPAGMVVHPSANHWSGTLANALVYHFKNLPTKEDNVGRPGLVHRIDKDTSGLLVIAKREEALVSLAKQFHDHTIERVYHALVWGEPLDDQGTITATVKKSSLERRVVVTCHGTKVGKTAVTHYKVLQRMHYVSLIECRLETGRTHQIRVHMKHAGYPIFGDVQYGGDRILVGQHLASYKSFVQNCLKIMTRQALHASSLGFIHPITRQLMYFESELPDDFKMVLKRWSDYIHHHNVT